MKRRILSLALTFVMAFALLTGMSTASDPKPIYDEIIGSGKCGDDLTWKLTEDGTLTISGTGKMTSAPWDAYRDKIKTLIIEDSVTNICNSAFNACRYLTTVTIPSSVVNVGIGAFSHCQGLTEIKVASGNAAYKDINGVLYDIEAKTLIEYPAGRKGEADLIPDTVTSIGERAFGGCVYLTDVTIPDSVTNIGTYAFVDCHSLVNTVIPDSVVTIGTCAFQRNDSLASITIPASVASIGEGVFGLCCSLTEIRVDPDNAAYCDIDGVLFSKDKTLLLAYPVGRGDASYTVPDGVTRIGTYVFSVTDMDMEKCVRSITIPDSVSQIDTGAFYNCDLLTDVYYGGAPIQWKQISIGGYNDPLNNSEIHYAKADDEIRFICGENLTWTLTDDGTLTISGTGEMWNWGRSSSTPWEKYKNQIKTTIIEDGVTSIGEYAFACCYYMTVITIPESVTSIGAYAFIDCQSLVNTVIPNSVATIGAYAFARNYSLASVMIPASVDNIVDNVFFWCRSLTQIRVDPDNTAYCDIDGVLFSKDKTVLLAYPVGRGDASYTVPDGVTRIGTYVFSVTDMDMEKCVRSITIPDSVSQIDTGAFYNCDLLTDVYYGGAPIQWKRISIGGNNDPLKNAEIHYAKTDDEIPVTITASGECGKNLTWELSSDGVLTISGYGEMTNWESFEAVPWYAYRDQIQKVVIKGAAVQAEPANLQARPMARGAILMSVPDADGVTSIGSYAFYGCANLKSVIIPDSVTNIGYNAFAQCKALEDVYYAGTQEQWMQIEAVDGSDMISAEVQIHYESTGGNTPGDADGNGAVNTTDVILVRRYIAGGYNVKIDENAADVDGNGVINTTDVILMRRFIAGGYGVVLKPGKIA